MQVNIFKLDRTFECFPNKFSYLYDILKFKIYLYTYTGKFVIKMDRKGCKNIMTFTFLQKNSDLIADKFN